MRLRADAPGWWSPGGQSEVTPDWWSQGVDPLPLGAAGETTGRGA
jgi:hypothetical protein